LRKTIIDMREELDKQRVDTGLLPSAKKVLHSVNNHWDGLTEQKRPVL
jgi:hypothetical protein